MRPDDRIRWWAVGLALGVLVVGGCATRGDTPGATAQDRARGGLVWVYLGQPPEVNYLCTLAAGPPRGGGTYRACYLPAKDGRPPCIVAATGDTEGLLHEWRHHFEGPFHP